MARRSNARLKEIEADQDELLLIPPDEVPEAQKESYWLQLVNNVDLFRETIKTIPFFKLVHDLPASLWERTLMMYAYRLEPKVRNESGPKYMEKIAQPVDEEYFKQTHGGGKYIIYLKCGETNLKEMIFAIDGAPKLQTGVIRVDAQGEVIEAAAPAQPPSDITTAVKTISDASTAASAMTGRSYENIIDTQRKVLERDLGLGAPKSVSDKLMDALIAKALNPPPPPDPMEAITKVLALVKEMTPRPAPVHQNPDTVTDSTAGLALVKDLFGVDSLHELTERVNAKSESPWYASVAQAIFEKGPQVLAQIAQMQRENWERQMFIMQQRTAVPGQAIQLPAATPEHIPGASPSPTSQPPTPQTIQQAVPQIVQQIVNAFDRGFSGGNAAAALHVNFEIAIAELAPMLSNPETLKEFIAGIPPLAQRATDADWPEFEQDFLEYIQEAFAEEEPKRPIQMPPTATTNTPPIVQAGAPVA